MTDRYSGFLVTLDHDVREDDAEAGVLTALRMIKGVISVEPVGADPSAESIAKTRLRHEIWDKVRDIILDRDARRG